MKTKTKLRPVGATGDTGPAAPPLAHDRSNRTFIADAAVRRSLRAARSPAGLSEHARHHTPRGEQS